MQFRNKLYNSGRFRTIQFAIPIISVGNLRVGGTGKTPMVAYLLQQLCLKNYRIAMLSRGYKRRSRGFLLAENDTIATALNIGDEPFLIYQQFKDRGVSVAVGEDRVVAISLLAMDIENLQVVVLDDAFQHRSIQPHLSILLTEYSRPYWDDKVLPLGFLREPIEGAARADIIIITKCPSFLNNTDRQLVLDKINPLSHQKVLFSFIHYEQPYYWLDKTKKINLHKDKHIFLFCGIENPESLVFYLKENAKQVETLFYPDHYYYKSKDLAEIIARFNSFVQKCTIDTNISSMCNENILLVTTEKDASRLWAYKDNAEWQNLPLYCLPIKVGFEANDEQQLQASLLDCIERVWAETGRVNNN